MIHVTETIAIHPGEIEERFVRASGPGGQNVNKVSTAVQLRFDAAASPSLPDDVKERLTRLAGRLMTREGTIVISAERFRSQERNRADALRRLVALVRRAAEPAKPRKATAPPPAARRERLEHKTRRGAVKSLRRKPDADE